MPEPSSASYNVRNAPYHYEILLPSLAATRYAEHACQNFTRESTFHFLRRQLEEKASSAPLIHVGETTHLAIAVKMLPWLRSWRG